MKFERSQNMKKLLIVVDYQVDFVNGALGFDTAESLADKIAARIKKARAEGEDIIFTLDTHDDNYLNTSEGKKLPIPHCIKGTEGHLLHPSVEALVESEDKIICKPTFGSSELFDYLRESDYKHIELCGLVSDICVISNAVLAKTAIPEAEITVDSSLCDSFDKSKHAAAMTIMESIQITVK